MDSMKMQKFFFHACLLYLFINFSLYPITRFYYYSFLKQEYLDHSQKQQKLLNFNFHDVRISTINVFSRFLDSEYINFILIKLLFDYSFPNQSDVDNNHQENKVHLIFFKDFFIFFFYYVAYETMILHYLMLIQLISKCCSYFYFIDFRPNLINILHFYY